MARKGNPFIRNYSIGDSFETKFPGDFIFEERVCSREENSKHLYLVPFEVVNHLRRHTSSYVKKLGGLKEILELPRRKDSRKVPSYNKDSILV